jgi:hypothetical protein
MGMMLCSSLHVLDVDTSSEVTTTNTRRNAANEERISDQSPVESKN